MKPNEMAAYKLLVFDQPYAVVTCWICGIRIRRGDRYCLVPADCDEQNKMRAGQPYNGLEAHWKCVEAIP
jgi:hypothetical protein